MKIEFKSNISTRKNNNKLANDLKEAMKEVQLYRQGKLTLKTAKELANELYMLSPPSVLKKKLND